MGFLGDIGNWLTKRPGEAEQRQGLLNMGQTGQADYSRLGGALDTEAERLRRQANGEDSLSAEQLRQGLQQNVAAQRSMAAGASPQNAAMAGLMASRNAMVAGAGLAGQQATAGIQERQAASDALGRMLLQQRQQEQQNAQFGYGNIKPGASWLDRFGGAVQAGAQIAGLGGFGGGGSSAPSGPQRSGPQPNGTYNPTWKY